MSPTLYLQDLVIFFLIAASFRKILNTLKKFYLLTPFFLLFVILNIVFSINKETAILAWTRIIEFVLLGMIITGNKEYLIKKMETIFPFHVLFQGLLGILQIVRGSSVGGFFWLLGERTFSIYDWNIARAKFLGIEFLRPYGTFSHPNSLSAFIFISLVVIFNKDKLNLLDKAAVLIGAVLLILCFSRLVWFYSLIFGLILLVRKIYFALKKKAVFDYRYFSFILFLPLLVFLFTKTSLLGPSLDIRRQLTVFSLNLIRKNFLIGIGANNFVHALSLGGNVWERLNWIQPVHNIFLLSFSELGIVGFLIFIFLFIYSCYYVFTGKNSGIFKSVLITTLCFIFFSGQFDHYWLTQIQNQLLLVLFLGLSLEHTTSPRCNIGTTLGIINL